MGNILATTTGATYQVEHILLIHTDTIVECMMGNVLATEPDCFGLVAGAFVSHITSFNIAPDSAL